jgi:hypothetical protein
MMVFDYIDKAFPEEQRKKWRRLAAGAIKDKKKKSEDKK